MANVTREQIGELHDRISVKIDKQDYLPKFEKDVKEFRKKANMPGFRKGMVPAGVIRKMYGNEFYQEAVIGSAEKELQNYLEKEKLEIFGQPIMAEGNTPVLDAKTPSEYEFKFEVGLKPEIKVDLTSLKKPIFYKIKVKPEDIQSRVDGLQTQFGKLNEVDSIENGDNIIKVQITQTDEQGQPVEGGISSEQSLYLKVFSDNFQKELTGRKKDDLMQGKLGDIVNDEKYPAVFDNLNIAHDDVAKKETTVSVKIISVNVLEKHPVDEELFKKAYPLKNISTEDELRKTLEEDEQKEWDKVASDQCDHELFHSLMETSANLPEEFLKKLLRVTESGKSEEEITNEIPSFLSNLKWSLIVNQVSKDGGLQVSTDELKEDVRNELKRYFGVDSMDSPEYSWTDSYVDRALSDKDQLESRFYKLRVQKVFDWVRSKVTPEEKEISSEDFLKLREEHHHHAH